MIARGFVIGAALIVMGMLRIFGNSRWTAVIGAVVLVAAGIAWFVRRQRDTGAGASKGAGAAR